MYTATVTGKDPTFIDYWDSKLYFKRPCQIQGEGKRKHCVRSALISREERESLCVFGLPQPGNEADISSASSAVLIRSPRLRHAREKRFCSSSRNVCEMFIWSAKDFEGLLWERVLTLHNSDATWRLGVSFLQEKQIGVLYQQQQLGRSKSGYHSSLNIYMYFYLFSYFSGQS